MTIGEAINNLAVAGAFILPTLVILYFAYMKRLDRQIEHLEKMLNLLRKGE